MGEQSYNALTLLRIACMVFGCTTKATRVGNKRSHYSTFNCQIRTTHSTLSAHAASISACTKHFCINDTSRMRTSNEYSDSQSCPCQGKPKRNFLEKQWLWLRLSLWLWTLAVVAVVWWQTHAVRKFRSDSDRSCSRGSAH